MVLTYTFSKEGKTPLYQQLYGFIKADILSGRLPPHSKLPSKRALAQHLTVSVATVQNAYEQLIAEGYLYAQEKQGHFVSALEPAAPPAPGPQESLPAAPPHKSHKRSQSCESVRANGAHGHLSTAAQS